VPDVSTEAFRADYDDAYEVHDWDFGDTVGVATLLADYTWHHVATGLVETAPVRVYVVNGDDGEDPGEHRGVYLSLESAREFRDALAAAIVQVEMCQHRRRRQP
jgi:hypothetical protein